jgi:hypothetical protein
MTMGYAFCTSPCINCGQIFSYNPMRVPSIPAALSPTGTREPICQSCVNRANPERIKRGLEPIVPFPDAYEPCDESELGS